MNDGTHTRTIESTREWHDRRGGSHWVDEARVSGEGGWFWEREVIGGDLLAEISGSSPDQQPYPVSDR